MRIIIVSLDIEPVCMKYTTVKVYRPGMVLIPAATLQNKLQNSVKVLLRAQGAVIVYYQIVCSFSIVCK